MPKMDKTAFKAHSFADARKYNNFSFGLSVSERIKEAYTLTITLYGYKPDENVRLDRTAFSMRKHKI